MAGRETDRSRDGEAGTPRPEPEGADRRPGTPEQADQAENRKAETDIAAGDVADDLADFA